MLVRKEVSRSRQRQRGAPAMASIFPSQEKGAVAQAAWREALLSLFSGFHACKGWLLRNPGGKTDYSALHTRHLPKVFLCR